jgi:rare lipoprotein A
MARRRVFAAITLAALLLAGGVAVAAPGIAGMARLRTGLASWYGGRFEGRRMANGCAFHAGALTAASRTLPIGAMVIVRRLHSPLRVVVTITDRGPYVEGRIIDLSRGAGLKLAMLADGLVLVSIEPQWMTRHKGCADDE